MTKLQTSLVAEETWVDGAAEKLASLPTATSAYELDVSIFVPTKNTIKIHIGIFFLSFFFEIFIVCKQQTNKQQHKHFFRL